MKEQSLREILIENIIDMAGDEYTTPGSCIMLAKKSDEQLVLEIINIAQYFREQQNN